MRCFPGGRCVKILAQAEISFFDAAQESVHTVLPLLHSVDLAQARRITYEQWQNRPWAEKLVEHTLALFRSQM